MANDQIGNFQISASTLAEAVSLAGEILKEIELSQTSLSVAMLKASRLARLAGNAEHQLAFEFEASGYPSGPGGVPLQAFELARIAGRVYKETSEDGTVVERANIEAVETIEGRVAASRLALEAARDPNVSLASSNPNQYLFSPSGNATERSNLRKAISSDIKLLAARRSFVHRYVAKTYDDLRFSGIAGGIFLD